MKQHHNCIFCSIRDGSQTCSRVHEDEHVLAFMDIRPVRPGQMLIIPKQHIDHFCDVPDELAMRIMQVGQRCARALRELFQPQRVGMVVHGFGVPHAHLMLMPLHHVWDITSAANSYLEDGVIKFRWEQVTQAPRQELDDVAARMVARLVDD